MYLDLHSSFTQSVVKLNQNTMNSKEFKTVLVNFIDILLLLSLLAVAIYFMHNCIIKFTDKTTYFEIQAQEKVGLESPTLTMCFGPMFQKSLLNHYNVSYLNFGSIPFQDNMKEIFDNASYQIGRDFTVKVGSKLFDVDYQYIDSVGKTTFNLQGGYIWITTTAIVTVFHGLCYMMVIESTPQVGFVYLTFYLQLKDTLKDVPDQLDIHITDKSNSDGIIQTAWLEGQEMFVETHFGKNYQTVIDLKFKKVRFLQETSNCSKIQSAYGCLASSLNDENASKSTCDTLCIPFPWKEYSHRNEDLPICDTKESHECMLKNLPMLFAKAFKVVSILVLL